MKSDVVYDRILATNSQNTFVYHTGNDCYKNYKRMKMLPAHPEESSEHERYITEVVETTNITKKLLRSSQSIRVPTCVSRTSEGNLKSKCVICNQITKKGVLEKHRIEEDSRAKMFIETAKANLDVVYERNS